MAKVQARDRAYPAVMAAPKRAPLNRQLDLMIAATAAAVPGGWSSPVLVGHSGFGTILPWVAERVGRHSLRIVFVDAGLPPCEGPATPGADFLDHLRELAVDGVLPKWSTWWGESVMEMLVPDVDCRVELEADMPEIPVAFFEAPLDVPEGWCQTPGSFLLLSEPYCDDAKRARSDGPPSTDSAVISTSPTTQTGSPA